MNHVHRAAGVALGLTTLVVSTLLTASGTAHAYPDWGKCSAGGFTGHVKAYKSLLRPGGRTGSIRFEFAITPGNNRDKANVSIREGRWSAGTAYATQDGYYHHLGTRTWKTLNGNRKRAYHFTFVFDRAGIDPRCSGTLTV